MTGQILLSPDDRNGPAPRQPDGGPRCFGPAVMALLSLGGCILAVFLLAMHGMTHSHSGSTIHRPQPAEWKTGYWIWQMYQKPYSSATGMNVDIMYVHAGSFHSRGADRKNEVRLRWPDRLPGASTYFALLRIEDASLPSQDIIPDLINGYQSIKVKAQKAGQQLMGIQIDFDCPTNQLNDYALFVKRLREALSPEDQLSITALLDWFRPGTDISELLRWVDEFIPQFYDVKPPGAEEDMSGIAAPVEPSRWASVFNSYGRPYRLGISVFGRITSIRKNQDRASTKPVVKLRFRLDETPMEIMKQMELQLLSGSRNELGEMILRFGVGRKSREPAKRPDSEETIEMIVPTADSLLKAYNGAKDFGGYCAGVVFYRWPSAREAMVLSPDEVGGIIAEGRMTPGKSRVEAEDGLCSTVSCANLYVSLGERFSESPVLLRIHSSMDLEYFIPCEGIKTRLEGPRTIEVSLPSYAGDPKIYLGRAVTLDPATFVLEEKR